MRLTWAGKLFAAAVGAKLVAEGLRYVAGMIPGDGGQLEVDCPACTVTSIVPCAGVYVCHACSTKFNVTG